MLSSLLPYILCLHNADPNSAGWEYKHRACSLESLVKVDPEARRTGKEGKEVLPPKQANAAPGMPAFSSRRVSRSRNPAGKWASIRLPDAVNLQSTSRYDTALRWLALSRIRSFSRTSASMGSSQCVNRSLSEKNTLRNW